MRKVLLLTGAYGRTANLADWNAGKDFRIVGGPYCSARDAALMKSDGYGAVLLVAPGAMAIRIDLNDATEVTEVPEVTDAQPTRNRR